MDFDEFGKNTIKLIDKESEKLLGDWRSEIKKIDKSLVPLMDKFIDGSLGGKRLRGALVVLGYVLGQGVILEGAQRPIESKNRDVIASLQHDKSKGDIYKVAAAYEIFHTAILAHDDVIDQSELRRNKPSLYKALGGGHSGVSQTICLGDAGFFLATKIISESNFSDKEKIKALSFFSQTMLDTAMGELLDVRRGSVLDIMKLKTAKYTVSGPLILGAILAGGSEKIVNALAKFGENLGIAFQIQDDILGIFGSEEILGKSVTSDIEEGKNTLLYNFALKKANKSQRKILDNYYGRSKISRIQVGQIKKVFIETGALTLSQEEIDKYKDRALKVLPEMTKDKDLSTLLEQLINHLIGRKK